MNLIKLTVLIILISSYSFSQNENRKFINVEKKSDFLEIIVNDGKYYVKPYTSEIIETTFIPYGEEFNSQSHAVIMSPNNVIIEFSETSNHIEYRTSGITVSIQKSPFQISYSYKGKKIISEKDGYSKIETGEAIQFNIDSVEILYGGGARALGMNRRGNRLQLYNKAHYGYESHSKLMNFTMPIIMSSKMYALHFDNAPIGYLDLDSKNDNTITYETISGRKTYQVIVGDSWLDLIDNYTDLTGKQPLPPRWVLGNFSSRFGYHSEKETRETVQKFIDEKIPLDAVIIDIYWFGKEIKGTMGNLEFLKDSFPTPKKMIADFQKKGIKTILVTEPFVLTTSNRWQEVVDRDVLAKDSVGNPFKFDFYFGNSGLIDIYNPKGKDWFWNIYKDLTNLGVQGIWGDLGEPEAHPSNLLHAIGAANEVHNIYGHDWARLIQEGYKRDFPNERPFILMRAGYSGSQKFGMIPWSGDVNRSWGGLQSQPEIALQMGMQGMAYMHSDLGGFAGANLDDELYTRWLQYGVFQPIYRPHAQEEVPAEPVFRSLTTKVLAKQSIELRYKLLPYNYTLAFQNNQTGAPLMRTLFFDEPNNKKLQNSALTYFWGKDFLVTPILSAGVKKKEIYFPINSIWFDFYTDEKIQGGQTKTIPVQENYIPTYVRAGAFIAMAKPMQTTNDYNANSFDLHYYHDTSVKTSKGNLYNDDGITVSAFEKGAYEMLHFKSQQRKKYLEFEFKTKTGVNYTSGNKTIDLEIHNMQKEPKRIKINKKKVEFVWNKLQKIVIVPVDWKSGKKLEINIKL